MTIYWEKYKAILLRGEEEIEVEYYALPREAMNKAKKYAYDNNAEVKQLYIKDWSLGAYIEV